MSKRKFTEEETRILRDNPFTFKVTDSHFVFTREFKEIYINEYNNGLTSRQIVEKYGYDSEILGTNRIRALHSLFCKNLQNESEQHEEHKKTLTVSGEEVTVDTIRKMQERIEYLEQEMEFVKKISSTRTSRK